jgi:hypothetical protein
LYPVLDRLGIGDRHEAHAGRRVLAGPDDDLALTPGQVVSAGDDVMTSSGHAVSMDGAGRHSW